VDFLHKAYSKVDFGSIKILDAIFSGQSQLLSTLVILKIKDLKTTNRDRKKVTKQGSRYSSVGI